MTLEDHVVMPQINLGDTGPNFIPALARRYRRLKSLTFTIYVPTPGVHERVAEATPRLAAEIVDDFLHHDNSPNEKWQVQATELTKALLDQKMANLPSNLALGVDSKCTLQDETTRYIPMMDFQPPPNTDNLELLKEFLNRIGYEGIIVESGASYHFYGFELLNDAEWIGFMGKCLLVPWSDPRWIGHSLLAGNGVLRISATDLKHKLPAVCEVLRR
jgi:hypothetical protein